MSDERESTEQEVRPDRRQQPDRRTGEPQPYTGPERRKHDRRETP